MGCSSRVLGLGIIDLLPVQPVEQIAPLHQQAVTDVKGGEFFIVKQPVDGSAGDAEVCLYFLGAEYIG